MKLDIDTFLNAKREGKSDAEAAKESARKDPVENELDIDAFLNAERSKKRNQRNK
jgi:hypothetical protein